MAYDMYQNAQRASRGIQAGPSDDQGFARSSSQPNHTTGRVQSQDPGLADEYYQQHGVRVTRPEEYAPPDGPPPAFRFSDENHMDQINGEVLKTAGLAPPSYEESVGHENRPRAHSTGDIKHRPAPVAEQHPDDSSEVSSIFETTGMMTPNTEMEANHHQQMDLLAQATQSASLQDRKAPIDDNEYSQPRALESQGRRSPQMDPGRISSIAQWLSQHESQSEHSARERRPERDADAPPYQKRDSFEDYWEKHPEHRPEALGLNVRETKLAIKAAYRAEKRALKDNYRAEKSAAKAARAQSKADFKAELRSLRRER